MGECFECTFFENSCAPLCSASQKIKNVLGIADGKSTTSASEIPLLKNQCIYFQSIDASGFSMHQLSIENFIWKRDTFAQQLDPFMQAVSVCFLSAPGLVFASGIYELTDYYLGSAKSMEAALDKAFRRFPLLLFREINRCPARASVIRRHQIACIVQAGSRIQNIFSDESAAL